MDVAHISNPHLALAVGHGHDAGDVVLLEAVLLLAEVAHEVAPSLVVLANTIIINILRIQSLDCTYCVER